MLKAWARHIASATAVGATTALAALALLATFGRVQVLPVRSVGEGVGLGRGGLALVEPVPAMALRPGDAVYLELGPDPGIRRGEGIAVHRVAGAVDAWDRRFEIHGRRDDALVVQLPPTVWRVRWAAPHLGVPFSVLVGAVPSVSLVGAGIGLIAWAEAARGAADRAARARSARHAIRSMYPARRVGARCR